MFKCRRKLRNVMLGVIASLLVSACGNSQTQVCIAANDFGDIAYGEFFVAPIITENQPAIKNGWLDTGILVQPERELTIESRGSVNLCEGSEFSNTKTVSPDVKSDQWYNTGIYINPGQKYEIAVSGTYSRWADAGAVYEEGEVIPPRCSGASAEGYWDENCQSKDGRGLFAYIGNPNNFSNWGELEPSPVIGSPNPEFYELYKYPSGPSGINIYSTSNSTQVEGYLYLKYADGNSGNGYNTDWSGDYSDNTGGYSVAITKWEGCEGTKGQYLVGYLGDPNLINISGASGAQFNAPPENVDPFVGGNVINLHPFGRADNNSIPPRRAGFYSQDSPSGGVKRLWLKIIDSSDINWNGDGAIHGDNSYTPFDEESGSGSNSGGYTVSVITPKPIPQGLNSIINELIIPVRETLRGSDGSPGLTQMLYMGVTNNIDFILAIRALMALSIVLFAFMYMVGLTKITQKELFSLSIKLAIVLALTSETSWSFFSEYLFVFFLQGTDSLIWLVSSQLSDAATTTVTNSDGGEILFNASGDGQVESVFSFLNHTMSIVFARETWIKVMALFSSFPLGTVVAFVFAIGIFYFAFAVMKALLLYLIAVIMTSLLLFIAPLCIPFLLFEKTKPVFEKWVRYLMNFALQPILLFTVLAIFNIFILSSLYQLIAFSVCWKCVLPLDLPISEVTTLNAFGNFDIICLISSYVPWGVEPGQGIEARLANAPLSLFQVLVFIILCNAMLKFIDWVVTISASFTVSAGGFSLNSTVNESLAEGAAISKVAVKSGVGASKFAVSRSAQLLDGLSGNKASDEAKRFSRGIKNKLPEGKWANRLSGGALSRRRAESDGMGGTLKYGENALTSNEKRALERERKIYNSLDKDAQAVMRSRRAKEQAGVEIQREGMSNKEVKAAEKKDAFDKGGKGNFWKDNDYERRLKEIAKKDKEVAKNNPTKKPRDK